MASDPVAGSRALPRRIPLSRSRRRLNFERRVRLWLWLLGVPSLVVTLLLLRRDGVLLPMIIIVLLCFLISWAFIVSLLMEQITHPLQTLANVVSALRTDDYSFRARGGRRNDAMGDLALELNRLADMMQRQRVGSMEAMALLDRVMTAMPSPVLAFDPDGALRVLNAAAERTFGLQAKSALKRNIFDLQLEELLGDKDSVVIAPATTRWMVRRSTFRLHGVPHSLVVLSDIGAALREEERTAWERLVRVLGHEINNSLAPIKSIAGSLRSRLPAEFEGEEQSDFSSGLEVIEDRAESLNRFLQAYRQLLGLPAPRRTLVSVARLLQHVAQLETRLRVEVLPGEDVSLLLDEDQMQQALINLVRNAAEAALSPDASQSDPRVQVSWKREASVVTLSILDNGAGLSNAGNLFVPFYTTKPGGSGIGLALVQQIAEAHKGSVTLANRQDGVQGCCAELRLPLG